MRLGALVAGLLLLAAPGSAWAGPNSWTEAGTAGQFAGQFVREIVVAPSAPGRIIVITDADVFRSEDGGATFVASSAGLAVPASMRRVAFDPADADRVWATGPSGVGLESHAWLSTDGGGSWVLEDGGMGGPVTSIAVDSAGTAFAGGDAVWRRGRLDGAWTDTGLDVPGSPASEPVYLIAVARAGEPYVAYGPFGHEMYTWMTRLTTASGWLPPQSAPRLTSVRGMVFGYDGTLWKATTSGLKYGPPGAELAFIDRGVVPSTSDVALEIGHPGRLWAAANDVYRTRDNGATWTATGFGPDALAVASTGTGTALAGGFDGLSVYTDTPPQAATGAASAIDSTSVTLNGTADVHGLPGSSRFVYGPSPSYGQTTTAADLAAAPGATPVSTPLTGLLPGTTYHYALLVTTSAGETVGADGTFTTAPAPGPPPPNLVLGASRLTSAWVVSRLRGTLRVSGTLRTAATVVVRLVDRAGRERLSRAVALPAGAFTRSLQLPATLLPGRYRLELQSGPQLESETLRLPAPAQGVVDRAFVAGVRGGTPATKLSARRDRLWARFHFASLPTRRALTVRWFGPRGAVSTPVGRARTRTVDAVHAAPANLVPGAWRAELRVGRVLVAVARVRLHS